MAWDRPRRCLRSRRSSTDDDDDTTMMIPEDLWADILKRLPVKKLLQVRSVCKSWKALISSPSFIKIHQCTVSSRLEVTETKSGDSLSSCRIGRKDPNNGFGCTITFKPLAFPQTPRYKLVNPSYLGVGHGVFMLCYLEPVVAFWNPAIRKHYLIPWPESENTPCRLDGFGLDPKTNDFKVVRSRMEGSYDVFSVREGAWRMNCQSAVLGSSSSPHLEACYLTGPYLDGAIYWITAPAIEGVYDWRSQGPFGLLRFDCASDEFTATDLPLELVSNPIAPHLLFPLGSGLVLIERLPAPDDDDDDDDIDICRMWAMHEGKDGSVTWTKAVAAGADHVMFSHFVLTPLATQPNRDYTRFRFTRFHPTAEHDFQETLLLMDVGSPDLS